MPQNPHRPLHALLGGAYILFELGDLPRSLVKIRVANPFRRNLKEGQFPQMGESISKFLGVRKYVKIVIGISQVICTAKFFGCSFVLNRYVLIESPADYYRHGGILSKPLVLSFVFEGAKKNLSVICQDVLDNRRVRFLFRTDLGEGHEAVRLQELARYVTLLALKSHHFTNSFLLDSATTKR